jgi:hypothetical protein
MYVYCVYPAMSKKLEHLSDLNKKDRNKRHSSPFINVVKGVFFVVRVTLVMATTLVSISYKEVMQKKTVQPTNKLFSLRINFPCTL